jgi:hypothetical protein
VVQAMAAEKREPAGPAQIGPGGYVEGLDRVTVLAADQQLAADRGDQRRAVLPGSAARSG